MPFLSLCIILVGFVLLSGGARGLSSQSVVEFVCLFWLVAFCLLGFFTSSISFAMLLVSRSSKYSFKGY